MKKLNYILFFLVAFIASNILAEESDFNYLLIDEPARFQNNYPVECHQLNLDDSQWPQLTIAEISPNQHYCLRFNINIQNENLTRRTVLWLAMLASNKIYWDGQFVGQKGRPGTSMETEETGSIGQIIPLFDSQLSPGKHLLSMEVSTYHHSDYLSSIFYGFMLVDQGFISKLTLYESVIPLLLMGALLLLTVVFQLIYWRYQKDQAFLVFSFLCFFSSFLISLELIKFYYAYPWDWHIVRLKFIILVNIITCFLLLYYYCLYYLIKTKTHWFLGIFTTYAMLGYFVPGYDIKSLAIFTVTLFSCLALNILALTRRKPGAFINTMLLGLGCTSLILLPFSFIDQWFAAVFAIIAISNIYSLMTRFGQDRDRAIVSLRLEAELLRRNLQPHFLMNSLMLIIEWIEEQPKLAVQFVESLAEEFRLLNKMSKQKLVSLKEELELCHKHCSIMAYRYQKQITLDVIGEDIDTKLPPAIIHTVIENAFSHNRIDDNDIFKIELAETKNTIQIKITTPNRARSHVGSGTGEDYILSRLKESYGDRWHYNSSAENDHWLTLIQLPIDAQG